MEMGGNKRGGGVNERTRETTRAREDGHVVPRVEKGVRCRDV